MSVLTYLEPTGGLSLTSHATDEILITALSELGDYPTHWVITVSVYVP